VFTECPKHSLTCLRVDRDLTFDCEIVEGVIIHLVLRGLLEPEEYTIIPQQEVPGSPVLQMLPYRDDTTTFECYLQNK